MYKLPLALNYENIIVILLQQSFIVSLFPVGLLVFNYYTEIALNKTTSSSEYDND